MCTTAGVDVVVVLYTLDFEPVTCVDIPFSLLEKITPTGSAKLKFKNGKFVTIYSERLVWRDGSVKQVIITPDEELALMLNPALLPGQIK